MARRVLRISSFEVLELHTEIVSADGADPALIQQRHSMNRTNMDVPVSN